MNVLPVRNSVPESKVTRGTSEDQLKMFNPTAEKMLLEEKYVG